MLRLRVLSSDPLRKFQTLMPPSSAPVVTPQSSSSQIVCYDCDLALDQQCNTQSTSQRTLRQAWVSVTVQAYRHWPQSAGADLHASWPTNSRSTRQQINKITAGFSGRPSTAPPVMSLLQPSSSAAVLMRHPACVSPKLCTRRPVSRSQQHTMPPWSVLTTCTHTHTHTHTHTTMFEHHKHAAAHQKQVLDVALTWHMPDILIMTARHHGSNALSFAYAFPP
jgi:hypothetical protein